MLLKALSWFVLAALIAALLWIMHGALLLPIRRGKSEDILITVSAQGDAPELEMQLRGLLWLKNNGIVPCSIQIVDAGLTPEALAAARCFAENQGIIISCDRGTTIHG